MVSAVWIRLKAVSVAVVFAVKVVDNVLGIIMINTVFISISQFVNREYNICR